MPGGACLVVPSLSLEAWWLAPRPRQAATRLAGEHMLGTGPHQEAPDNSVLAAFVVLHPFPTGQASCCACRHAAHLLYNLAL